MSGQVEARAALGAMSEEMAAIEKTQADLLRVGKTMDLFEECIAQLVRRVEALETTNRLLRNALFGSQ